MPYNKEGVYNIKVKDLTDKKFGRLTVIGRSENHITSSGRTLVMWKCKCDCQNECEVNSYHLTSGNTKSCGCLQKEKASNSGKLNKKYNAYNLSGKYGIGYTLKNESFYFDLEDYDLIKNYCWFTDDGYLVAKNEKGKHIFLHRLIMNFPDYMIDHKNGNENDCKKNNLRLCTSSKNQMNRKLNTNNTSGAKGIIWSKSHNKWRARICVNKKYIHLGLFDNFDDAVKARKEAEEKYFGEWSYDNSRKEEVI